MADHSNSCDDHQCMTCKDGPKAAEKWEVDTFSRLGYYIHYVPEEDHINAHTHGFDISWDHLDFQIVMPLPADLVSSLLGSFAQRVKDGERFEAGTQVEGGSKFGCCLVSATENERTVLRIVFPDQNGKYPLEEGCANAFNQQLAWET